MQLLRSARYMGRTSFREGCGVEARSRKSRALLDGGQKEPNVDVREVSLLSGRGLVITNGPIRDARRREEVHNQRESMNGLFHTEGRLARFALAIC